LQRQAKLNGLAESESEFIGTGLREPRQSAQADRGETQTKMQELRKNTAFLFFKRLPTDAPSGLGPAENASAVGMV